MNIKLSKIPGRDFTHYIPVKSDEGEELLKSLKDEKGEDRYSCSPPTVIDCGRKKTEVRALACCAYRRRFFSVTIRCEGKGGGGGSGEYFEWVKENLEQYAKEKYRRRRSGQKPPQRELRLKDFLGYCPGGYEAYSQVIFPKPAARAGDGSKASPRRKGRDGEDVFLNDIYRLCKELDKELFGKAEPKSPAAKAKTARGKPPGEADMASHPGGLIVVTGATNSSKSLITRGLIFLILERAARQARAARARRPHLVTFEDPIEKYYVTKPPGAETASGSGPGWEQMTPDDLQSLLGALYLDYTPRERGQDADSLKHVVEDALRQTPAVLFVGETRAREDWKELLQFANTGHLVITTSHAKSVVEAMSDIFRDTETKTQAQRSEIARRIVGVVNVRRFTPEGSSVRALLPALWKSTPKSTANLVADGLASILPAQGREAEIGYYGRKYFAKLLTAESPPAEKLPETEESSQTGEWPPTGGPPPKPWEPPLSEKVLAIGGAKRRKILARIMKTANEWDFEGV